MNEKSKTPVVSCAYRCGTVNWRKNKFMMCQKLVRDNIPAIIEKNGETCVTRTLSDKEYEDALTNKLQEEVAELLGWRSCTLWARLALFPNEKLNRYGARRQQRRGLSPRKSSWFRLRSERSGL